MTMELEPDLFTLLELDPDAPWSQLDFEAAEKSKRSTWARLLTKSTKTRRIEIQTNLDLLKKEGALFAHDPSVRAKHAQRARDRKDQTRSQSLTELRNLLLGKAELDEGEFRNLVARFTGRLSEDDVRSHVNVPIVPQREVPVEKTVPKSSWNDIQTNLAVLGEESLYSLLGDTEGKQATSWLFAEATGRSQKLRHDQRKGDPQIMAESSLVTHALNWFKNDEMRAQYDATITEAGYSAIIDGLKSLAATFTIITEAQIQALVEQAVKADGNLDPEIALDRITQQARTLKIPIQVSSVEPLLSKQRCGWCRELNTPEANNCTRCSRPLKEPCPKCKTMVPSSDRACSKCGFATGQREVAETLYDSAEEERSKGNLNRAKDTIEQAVKAWSAPTADPLMQKITTLQKSIEKEIAERNSRIDEIEKLIDARKFVAAEKQMRLIPQNANRRAELNSRVGEGLANARNLFAQAQKLQGEDAVNALEQVLLSCVDFEDAATAMRKIAPEAPTNLSAESGTSVRLTWRPGRSRNVTHLVIRKSGSRPTSHTDGEEIASVAGTSFDDVNPPSGEILWYAVFADRRGVQSPGGAQLRSPVLIAADVTNIVSRTDATALSFSFQSPRNVRRVFAVRSNTIRPPADATDGVIINSGNKRELFDTGLRTDQMYQYAIYCEYEDHQGNSILSRGVRMSATPTAPPAPILDLSVTAQGEHLQLNWTPATKGVTHIISSTKPLGTPGHVISATQLPQLGSETLMKSSPATINGGITGVRYFTPIVVFEGSAYIGQTTRFVSIPDVGGLRAQYMGDSVQLFWTWPPSVEQVLLSTAIDSSPTTLTTFSQSSNGSANRRLVTKAEYDMYGHVKIENPGVGVLNAVVQTAMSQGPETFMSQGVRQQLAVGEQSRIEYEIHRPFLSRRRYLVLKTRGRVTLPTLILQGNPGAPPLSRNSGERLLTIQGPFVVDTEAMFEISTDMPGRDNMARLFAQDESTAHLLSIQHPLPERLRL